MRPSLLLVEDEPICREPLARLLRLEGMNVACAADGIEALRALRAAKPQLLLLDLTLPLLSGMDVLRAIRRHDEFRDLAVIILTGSNEQADMRAAALLGVSDYVLKQTFSFNDLLKRIRRSAQSRCPSGPGGVPPPALAPPAMTPPDTESRSGLSSPAPPPSARPLTSVPAGRVPQLLSRDEVLERVGRFAESKTLAGVVAQVVSMASSPRGSAAELVTLLRRDAVLATRVLQVANTAAYTSNKAHVGTIEEAVRNIGLVGVRNIALSAGVFESFPADARDGFNLLRCWQHSLAVAAILERLLEGVEGVEPGVAYLVGLCHDLGEMLLRQALAEQYDELAEVGHGTGTVTHQVESAAFGIPYAELTERILGRLGLPAAIVNPAREHADRRPDARPTSRVAHALRIADRYAHGLQLASSPRALLEPVTAPELRAARGDAPAVRIDGVMLRAEVLSATVLLARVPRAQEAELTRPLVPATNARVWYARHPVLVDFDPLEVGLQGIAQVTTHPRLPAPTEVAEYDVLLVATPKVSLPPLPLEEAVRVAAPSTRVVYLARGDIADTPVPGAMVSRYPLALAMLAQLVGGVPTE